MNVYAYTLSSLNYWSFSSPVQKYRAVVTLMFTSAFALMCALASHLKVVRHSFFFVIGKVLSGELSRMRTGLLSKYLM